MARLSHQEALARAVALFGSEEEEEETEEERRRREEEERRINVQEEDIDLTNLSNQKALDRTNALFGEEEYNAPIQTTRTLTEGYDIDDLEDDEEFQQTSRRFLTSVGSDDRIFEYLRDSDYRLTSAIHRLSQSRSWTDQQKRDYQYLRSTFDNASIGGFKNVLGAIKDMGIDAATDPVNLAALPFIVSSGGLLGIGLGVVKAYGTRQAAKLIAKQLATATAGKKGFGLMDATAQVLKSQASKNATRAHELAQSQAFRRGARQLKWVGNLKGKNWRNASIGMTEGAYNMSIDNIFNQATDIQASIRQDVDESEYKKFGLGLGGGTRGMGLAGATLMGTGFGGGLSGIGIGIGAFLSRGRVNKALDEHEIIKSAGGLSNKDKGVQKIKDIKFYEPWINRAISWTLGKSSTEFKHLAKVSPKIAEFLTNIRYDALRNIVADPLTEKVTPSYAIEASRLAGKYQVQIRKALDLLERVRRPKEKRKWYTTLALDVEREQQDQVLSLLSDPRLLELNKITNGRKQARIKNDILKEANASGRWENPITDDIFEASLMLRNVTELIRKDANNIVGPDGATRSLNVGEVINYVPRHWNLQTIIDDFGTTDNLKKLLIEHGNADPLDFVPEERFLYEPELKFGDVTPFSEGALGYTPQGVILKGKSLDPRTIDQQIFGDVLKGVKSFEELARKQLDIPEEKVIRLTDETGKLIPDPNQKLIDDTAKELKAAAIIDSIINRRYNPFGSTTIKRSKGAVGERLSFLQHRPFGNIPDEKLREYGFISNDLESIFNDYSFNASSAIARTKFFGKTEEEFTSLFLDPIRKELKKAGMPDGDELENTLKGLTHLYKRTTGLDVSATPSKIRWLTDSLKLSQMLAHLPFAAISSLTEPFIALTKADLPDSNKFVQAFAAASGYRVRKSFSNLMDRMSAISGKKIKNFNSINDADYQEVLEAGLALEQSAMQRLENMYGSGMNTGWAKGISNLFFSANILQPWTQAVQAGAFTFSKGRSLRIIKELVDNEDYYGTALSKNQIVKRQDQLFEIGIDVKSAKNTYKNSLNPDGSFNMGKWRNTEFYQQDMMSSASLFAREIILNPSAAEANKPTWFNSWGGQLLMQFAGYPTAFNNIVLKGMARDLTQGQGVGGRLAGAATNAPKMLGALTLMTGVASITNVLRSYGENLYDEEGNAIKISDIPSHKNLTVNAIRRWGGLGPYEYLYRYTQGRKYGGGQTGAALKAFPGPLAADFLDAAMFRQGIPEMLVQNIPGWSALPYDVRTNLKERTRNPRMAPFKQLLGKERPRSRGIYDRGGLVNVPNTPAEPEDRLMRNDVNTFKDAAGFIVEDLEDRQRFQTGSEVNIPNTPSDPASRKIRGRPETFEELAADRPNFAATDLSDVTEGNDIYQFLTREEDTNPFNEYRRDDPTPVNTYTQGDIELENVGTDRPYYTSLPENTNFAWRNDIRQSLGRLVVDSPEDLPKENDVQIEGYVRFKKAITIDSDRLDPDSVMREIENLNEEDISADPDLSFEIVQVLKEKFNQWDSEWNKDTLKTEQTKQLMEQTKGSMVRNAFLKLGIDALEFKNGSGFVLLLTNQFFPTRVVNAKRRGFAFGSLATTLKDRKLRNQVNNTVDTTLGSQMDQLGFNRQQYALGGIAAKALRKLFMESLKRYTRFVGEIDGVKIQKYRTRTLEEIEQEFFRSHPNRPLPTKKQQSVLYKGSYKDARQIDKLNYNEIKNRKLVAPNPEPLAKMKNEIPLKEGASDLRENLIVLEKALSLRGDRSASLLNRMYDILDPSKSKEGEKRIIDFLKFFNTSGKGQTYNIQGSNKTIKDFQPYLPFKFDDKTGRYIDIKAEKPDITGQPSLFTKSVETVYEEQTPEGRAWARYNRKDNKVYINRNTLKQKFEDKAWTKPLVDGVIPLDENEFKTIGEWEQFVTLHEQSHAVNFQAKNETKAAYENRTNQIVLRQMREPTPDDTLQQNIIRSSSVGDTRYIDRKGRPRDATDMEKASIKREDELKSTSGEQPTLGDKVSNTLTDPSLTRGGYDPVDLPPMTSKTDELRQARQVALSFESKVLNKPQYKKLRTNIMNAWKETGYTGKQLEEDDNVFDIFNLIVQDFIPDRNIKELGLDDETDIVVSSIFEEIVGRQKFEEGGFLSKLIQRFRRKKEPEQIEKPDKTRDANNIIGPDRDSVAAGDIEFEMEVSNRMGPYRREALDASRYKVLQGRDKEGRPIDVRRPGGALSWYSDPNFGRFTTEQIREAEKKAGWNVPYEEAGLEGGESDMVYSPSMHYAIPSIQAHEFGHRGDHLDWTGALSEPRKEILRTISSVAPEKQQAEVFNQLFDVWRSDTPEGLNRQVRTWMAHQNDLFKLTNGAEGKDYYEVPLKNISTYNIVYGEALNDLTELIHKNWDNLLALEVDALEQQHLRRQKDMQDKGISDQESSGFSPEIRTKIFQQQSNSAQNRAKRRFSKIDQSYIQKYSLTPVPTDIPPVYSEEEGREHLARLDKITEDQERKRLEQTNQEYDFTLGRMVDREPRQTGGLLDKDDL